MHRRIIRIAAAVTAAVLAITSSAAAQPAPRGLLARAYTIGDSIAYHMEASNFGHRDSVRYGADVGGRVARDSAGHLVEQLAWSSLVVNGKAAPIAPGARNARQVVTLAPGTPSIPDMRTIDPRLVGPMLDLLTFYVDLQLAGRMPSLARAGDHARVVIPVNPSWGDGRQILRGEDAVDFDFTLERVDSASRVATLVVRHVPPVSARIKMPAPWMDAPVVDTPNNWIEVAKLPNGRVAGRVGKETFEVRMRVDLEDGRILGATLDNPVDVLERECSSAALTDCGEPIRYRILRTIAIDAR